MVTLLIQTNQKNGVFHTLYLMIYQYHMVNMNERGTDSATDLQESEGFSISYTMGGTTIAASFNDITNVAGSAAEDNEGYEVNVSFAF